MKRVLLIDSHADVRSRLCELINGSPGYTVAAEANTQEQALDYIRLGACDVAVLSMQLVGCNALDLVRAIKHLDSKLPILILDTCATDAYRRAAFTAGADGYLSKDEATTELAGALRSIIQS